MSKNIEQIEAPLDFAGLIFRASFTYMQSGVMGNTAGKHEAVQYIEILLSPYMDNEYHDDIDAIEKELKKTSRAQTPSQVRVIMDRNAEIMLVGKYSALMKLAYRCGFLPPIKHQSSTKTEMMS